MAHCKTSKTSAMAWNREVNAHAMPMWTHQVSICVYISENFRQRRYFDTLIVATAGHDRVHACGKVEPECTCRERDVCMSVCTPRSSLD
jgi:hypothetical protein